MPKQSASSKILGCQNPKCEWISGPNVLSRCPDCIPGTQNCTQTCPIYTIQYGSGSTLGLLLSETLKFPQKAFADFIVGCSIFSIRQPAGIAGFGRSQESLPSQLGLSKFSHCLISRRFDDSTQSSDLVLYRGSTSDAKTPGVKYTPFLKNPVSNNSAFREYYYLNLRKVLVGGKSVNIPYKYLVPSDDGNGNGGTVVDSGSTFTFMEKPVFEPVAHAFAKQMANFPRAADVESQSGLSPCFNVSGVKAEAVKFPELAFHFKGGAKLELPVENYIALAGNSSVCLTIISDNGFGPDNSVGPAIILGNFQQQNFYVEYDLENERFGFRQQSCK